MLTELPNPHALFVLILTVVALFLFTRDKIPLESTSLMVLAALTAVFSIVPYKTAQGEVDPLQFFHGFGHEALVAVCALMIIGQGMVRTGALEPVGRVLAKMWTVRPTLSLGLTLIVGATLSAFVNNTPIVVLLLPILISVALRANMSASSVLMPMGFATLIGGMGTTIGTSTNLLVVAVAADLGLPRIELFDLVKPVAICGGVGLLYLWFVAPKLIPERKAVLEDESPRLFQARLSLPNNGSFDSKTLGEIIQETGNKMRVTRILRGQNTYLLPLPDAIVHAGDYLIVRDTPQRLKEYESALGGELFSGEDPVDDLHPLKADDQQLAEIVVFHGSPLVGERLGSTRFTERYQLAILALHREGKQVVTPGQDMLNLILEIGDVLLIQGPRDQISNLKQEKDILVLDATADLPHTEKAPIALAILIVVVALAALSITPIAVSAVCGVLIMILAGCISWNDAAKALNTQVIMIVAASLALGAALLETGGTQYLTVMFLKLMDGAPTWMMLSGLMLLMTLLTNIVSNNAAAVIGTPIAVGIAQSLEITPEPFVLAVLFGANMSYATPLAYKTNILVMNAGGYRFTDFLRIGVPLTLIMWVMFSIILPWLYL